MTYVIKTKKRTTVGAPFSSYDAAITAASQLFGANPTTWIKLNVRVEEARRL